MPNSLKSLIRILVDETKAGKLQWTVLDQHNNGWEIDVSQCEIAVYEDSDSLWFGGNAPAGQPRYRRLGIGDEIKPLSNLLRKKLPLCDHNLDDSSLGDAIRCIRGQ
ncbi:MAG: hypothetical protein OXC83_02155 [Chloroflexi bacterium]|nr:hypothetical protein [Chloroflexota bacterium]